MVSLLTETCGGYQVQLNLSGYTGRPTGQVYVHRENVNNAEK